MLEKSGLLNINWKVFIASCICTFVMTSLLQLGIRLPRMLGQQFSQKSPQVNVFNQVKLKLDHVKNTFQIQTGGLIKEAQAQEDLVDASSYLVADYQTGEILGEKNSTKSLPIASL